MARRTWAGLADRRATTLLAPAHVGGRALVVAAAAGFPPPALDGATTCAPTALERSDDSFDTVIDTTRPEEPADHGRLLDALVRSCRPDGTIAVIACGGVPAADGPGAPRSLALVRTRLAAAGWAPVRVVPFDLLGPLSPWRLGLGGRADRVLAELDAFLRFRSVRAAVRFLERELVAALPCERVGRALVVARRGAGAIGGGDPGVTLECPDRARRVLAHLQHDAVVRFAAFLDAEFLVPAGVHFDLARYLVAVSATAGNGDPARARALRERRCWFPGYDARRFVEAVSHRMAQRAVEALAAAAGPTAGLAESFDYALFETCNAALDRFLDDPWTARSSS